jgi:hypothetical protein
LKCICTRLSNVFSHLRNNLCLCIKHRLTEPKDNNYAHFKIYVETTNQNPERYRLEPADWPVQDDRWWLPMSVLSNDLFHLFYIWYLFRITHNVVNF